MYRSGKKGKEESMAGSGYTQDTFYYYYYVMLVRILSEGIKYHKAAGHEIHW